VFGDSLTGNFHQKGGAYMILKIRGNGRIEPVNTQPHESVFRNWIQFLPSTAFQGICNAVNEYINREGHGEIVTSRWFNSSEWTQTAYQPIYEAVGQNWEAARLFLGLIVWRVMMDRKETWVLKRYPRKMSDVIDLTYFRIPVNLPTYHGLAGTPLGELAEAKHIAPYIV
jgi:hypothetical protein